MQIWLPLTRIDIDTSMKHNKASCPWDKSSYYQISCFEAIAISCRIRFSWTWIWIRTVYVRFNIIHTKPDFRFKIHERVDAFPSNCNSTCEVVIMTIPFLEHPVPNQEIQWASAWDDLLCSRKVHLFTHISTNLSWICTRDNVLVKRRIRPYVMIPKLITKVRKIGSITKLCASPGDLIQALNVNRKCIPVCESPDTWGALLDPYWIQTSSSGSFSWFRLSF